MEVQQLLQLFLLWAALASAAHAQTLDCNFDTDFCSWTQASSDNLDWIQDKNTSSLGTGPGADHTGGGSFIYMEASNVYAGYNAVLLSPNVTITTGGCLKLWYHMYGVDIGNLNIYAGSNFELLWNKHGNQNNSWKSASVNIPAGSNIQVMIEATRGGDLQGDVAIDDITFTNNGLCHPDAYLDGLQIKFDHPSIVPGMTEQLTLTCSMQMDIRADFVSLVSLVILMWNPQIRHYDELAMLSAFNPDSPTSLNDHGARLSGYVDNNGRSYLIMEWVLPGQALSGNYVCESNLYTTNGHTETLTVATDVGIGTVDLHYVLEMLRDLKNTVRNLTRETVDLTSTVSVMEENLKMVSEIAQREGDDNLTRMLFHDTTLEESGMRFYYSVISFFSFDEAQAACSHLGGFLVELSQATMSELSASYKKIETRHTGFLYIGVIRNGSEPWTFSSTGVPAKYQLDNSVTSNTGHCLTFDLFNDKYKSVSCRQGFNRACCSVPN